MYGDSIGQIIEEFPYKGKIRPAALVRADFHLPGLELAAVFVVVEVSSPDVFHSGHLAVEGDGFAIHKHAAGTIRHSERTIHRDFGAVR